MKAIVYSRYGSPDVLQLKDVERPTPADDEVLIRVHAASVNQYDWHLLTADFFLVRLMGGGLLKPKHTRLGADVAGRVEATGRNVKQFRPGDEVFGLSTGSTGSFAEYVCAQETSVVAKPAGITFEQAAAVPMAALTALQSLRDKGRIQAGQKVLINGASGGVGTFAVQVAKSCGADVTAVCSTKNLDMARSIGADHVTDYTQEDFTESGRLYDVILAVNGYHPLADYRRALGPKGIYVMVGGSLAQVMQAMLLGPAMSHRDGKTMGGITSASTQQDLTVLRDMLAAGKLVPVIERRYPLSETAEALRHLGAGHAMGKVVITVKQNGTN